MLQNKPASDPPASYNIAQHGKNTALGGAIEPTVMETTSLESSSENIGDEVLGGEGETRDETTTGTGHEEASALESQGNAASATQVAPKAQPEVKVHQYSNEARAYHAR